MKNLLLKKLGIVFVTTFMLSAVCYADDGTHGNSVNFENITLKNFDIRHHTITDGQIWKTYSIDSKNNSINIVAGRKGSISNSQWLDSNGYNNRLHAGNVNFAFIGDIHFTYIPDGNEYVCKDIAMQQAGIKNHLQYHTVVHNIWSLSSNIERSKFASYDAPEERMVVQISCTSLNNMKHPSTFYVTATDMNSFSINKK